jgi:hypothetical protein
VIFAFPELTGFLPNLQKTSNLAKNDPPIGYRLKGSVMGFPAGPLTLVYVGDCASCSLRQFSPEKLGTNASQTLFIFRMEPSEENWKRFSSYGRKHLDDNGNLGRELNAYFTPRIYRLSEDRSIVSLSTERDLQKYEVVRK